MLTRGCFDSQIGRCPGVCTGAISKAEYRKIIRQLIKFFSGKKDDVVRGMRRDMKRAALAKDFELAADLRNKVESLEHINDVALIMRDDDWDLAHEITPSAPQHGAGGAAYVNVLGRIEAYDIANISGTSNVASMVVFENGQSNKNEYRKFRIKTVDGANDVAAMEEVMRRRLARVVDGSWPIPDLVIIDGGEGQVNRVKEVMKELGVEIPVFGIAKGFDRKQDRLVFDESNPELRRIAESSKDILQRARDEAHRFAGTYHRVLRSKASGIPRRFR